MEMKQNQQLQQKLKKELEELSKTQISPSDAWEAVFNLSGFIRVLQKMKKEAQYGNVQN